VPKHDIKCFSESWGLGQRMDAKIYKVLSHWFIDDEWAVWIDGSIKLKLTEQQLINMTKPYNVGVFYHPGRRCVYGEGEHCINRKKDDPAKIRKQLNYYREIGYPEMNGLAFCGIIIRRQTKKVKELNEEWWEHIKAFSVRDQISFPVVFDGYIKYLSYTGGFLDNDCFTKYYHRK
jgi:hypothetical protein